jgi:hypothetical protein
MDTMPKSLERAKRMFLELAERNKRDLDNPLYRDSQYLNGYCTGSLSAYELTVKHIDWLIEIHSDIEVRSDGR